MNKADISRDAQQNDKGNNQRLQKEEEERNFTVSRHWGRLPRDCRDCWSLSSEISQWDWRRPTATWSSLQGSPASSQMLDQMTSRGPSPSTFICDCMILHFSYGMPMLSSALRTYRQMSTLQAVQG